MPHKKGLETEPYYGYSAVKMHDLGLSKLRHAVHFFNMIEKGDRIIIGVSGGADSLCLLSLLASTKNNWRSFAQFYPVLIDAGFPQTGSVTLEDTIPKIERITDALNLTLRIERRDIKDKAFNQTSKQPPCFTCSKLRRKALLETAEALGANKIALGHHRDDALETFLLNLFYSRELSTMMPVQELFEGKYKIIRPLYLMEKRFINLLTKKMNLPIYKNPCTEDQQSQRKMAGNILNTLDNIDNRIRKNIFRALFRPKNDYLPEKYADILKQL
jgi:tRNA 2-thiocytidine biosynthesis protein TtcA